MALSEEYHVILQALMSRGPQTQAATQTMVAELFESQTLELVQARTNRALAMLHLEMRSGVHQRDGSVWYSVVNRLDDQEAKLGSKYSHQQIQFFKAIVEYIVLHSGGTGIMRSIDVHNIVSSAPDAQGDEEAGPSSQGPVHRALPRPLTGTDKDSTVRQLVDDKWLELIGELEEQEGQNGVKLGVRTFLELRQYIRSMDGVPECDYCREPAVEARLCDSDICNYRVHFYCEPKKFRRQQDVKCGSCGAPWPYAFPGQGSGSSPASAGSSGGKARRGPVRPRPKRAKRES